MPTITDVTSVTRQPDRLAIKVDGRVVARLSRKLIDELAITCGQAWTSEVARRVALAAATERVERDAMRMINRRATSAHQLVVKLKERGHDELVISNILDRLRSWGAIDDEALGRALINQLTDRRPAGRRWLVMKLRGRGLEPSLVDRLVHEHEQSAPDAATRAQHLAEAQRNRVDRFDLGTQRRRLGACLARRGFEADAIESALAAMGL